MRMKLAAVASLGAALGSSLLVTSACSSKHDDGSTVSPGSAGSTTVATGSGGADGSAANGGSIGTSNGNTGGTLDLNIDGGEIGGSGAAPGAGGSPEICDGIDNDNDGIIDDVDKNGDGVCDCLLIATLGVTGTWGKGDVFATWLSARSDTGATDLADQTLTPELLAKYEIIVAQDVSANHQYTDDEVKALSDWVNKGGGFMTLIGYGQTDTEIDNVNRLLAPFSMSYLNMHILPKPRTGNPTQPITMWNPHPIDMGVTAVGVDNGYPVSGMGDVIATGGGYDLGVAQTVGSGHVFAWADEWITYNSEWDSHPDYQVKTFWVNAVKWLTVAAQCEVAPPPNPPK